jgi:FKBP-type peptidyl-prolyl cis-trans isomerase SlyD
MIHACQFLAAALLLLAPMSAAAQTQPAPATAPAPTAIEQGSTVQIEYTLKDKDAAGEVLDTNKGQAPLTYTQGQEQILPELEKQLSGLHAGEEKKVTLKPEDGYGTVNPAAQAEVPKEILPATALTVGTRLMARNASGEARPVTVKEIKDKTVVLDLNHPLAGKTLFFEVKVLDVQAPKAPESPPPQPKPTN